MPVLFAPGLPLERALPGGARPCDAIVNPVNCRGTGKRSRGVAGLVFRRFPAAHAAYLASCRAGRFFPGAVQVAATGEASLPHVINAATKDHWRDPSQLAWIEAIAAKLPAAFERAGAGRVAIPMLGCGEGGLDWDAQVGPALRDALQGCGAVAVLLGPSPRPRPAPAARPG